MILKIFILNNALEWKLAGTATGKTEIALSDDFKELCIIVSINNKQFPFSIPRIYLDSTEKRFLNGNGIYLTEYNLNFCDVYVTETTVKLNSCRESANDTITDSTTKAITTVYYR